MIQGRPSEITGVEVDGAQRRVRLCLDFTAVGGIHRDSSDEEQKLQTLSILSLHLQFDCV